MGILDSLKGKAKGTMNAMELMPKLMGIITGLMAKNKDAILEQVSEFITQDNISYAAANLVKYYQDKQREKGEQMRYRIVLSPDTDNTDLIIMVYECEEGKNTPVFEKSVSRITETEVKFLIDALLSMLFA